jgi:hypothetical protein
VFLLRAHYVRSTNLSIGILQGLCQLVYSLYFSITYELMPVLSAMVDGIFKVHYGARHQNGALVCAVPSQRNALNFGAIPHG